MRQGAADEAVNLAVRQSVSRPQLKRDPLGGARRVMANPEDLPWPERVVLGVSMVLDEWRREHPEWSGHRNPSVEYEDLAAMVESALAGYASEDHLLELFSWAAPAPDLESLRPLARRLVALWPRDDAPPN